MTDTPPTPPTGETSSIADELSALGKNLVAALRSALNSEESKKVQKEIESGLNEAIASLQKAADDFAKSDTGQQMKSDLADLNQRIESGELQAKVRSDVLTALQTANAEIQKAAARFSKAPETPDQPAAE
jgi:predicted  nucleic acid-binding Zn-ribbon protein